MEAVGWRLIPFKEALEKLEEIKPKPVGFEAIPTTQALGRILAEDIVSEVNVPKTSLAFMDGYALKAEDALDASELNPISLRVIGKVFAGEIPTLKISSGQSVYISHYSLIPEGANAIAPVEAVDVREGEVIL